MVKKVISLILGIALILGISVASADATRVIIATEGAYAPYNYESSAGRVGSAKLRGNPLKD